MTETRVSKASRDVHALDDATQSLIKSIESKDRRFRFWAYTSLTVLLVVGIIGIYKQNQIANANKVHIDCIVKLFTTPQPAGTAHKIITNPNGNCDIKGSD